MRAIPCDCSFTLLNVWAFHVSCLFLGSLPYPPFTFFIVLFIMWLHEILAKLILSRCVQWSFQQICMRGGCRGLPYHVLMNQPYSPSYSPCFYFVTVENFSFGSPANLLSCPSHHHWKSEPCKYCVRYNRVKCNLT